MGKRIIAHRVVGWLGDLFKYVELRTNNFEGRTVNLSQKKFSQNNSISMKRMRITQENVECFINMLVCSVGKLRNLNDLQRIFAKVINNLSQNVAFGMETQRFE